MKIVTPDENLNNIDKNSVISEIKIVEGRLLITYSNGEIFDVGAVSQNLNGTDGLEYFHLSDGTLGVSVGKAIYLEEINIPSEYNGTPVTQII